MISSSATHTNTPTAVMEIRTFQNVYLNCLIVMFLCSCCRHSFCSSAIYSLDCQSAPSPLAETQFTDFHICRCFLSPTSSSLLNTSHVNIGLETPRLGRWVSEERDARKTAWIFSISDDGIKLKELVLHFALPPTYVMHSETHSLICIRGQFGCSFSFLCDVCSCSADENQNEECVNLL